MKRFYLLGLFLVSFSHLAWSADVDGTVAWTQRVVMSTTVSGVVDEIIVNSGDRVSKGDVLLRLQADRFNASLSSAKAANNDAQYKLNEAEREWDRAQELYERTVLSDRDLQLAENGLVAAKAMFASASAQYINAKRDLIESVIRAPFDAVVLERHVQTGQTVITRMKTVPMISLAATKTYNIIGAISSAEANKLATGQTVAVSVSGQRYNGILTSIGYEPVKAQDAYPVTVKFTTGGALLRVGQPATIHFK